MDRSSENTGFLYLDQEAVLAADVLDMRRAIEVVGQAQALFAEGKVREPNKVVLRRGDTVASTGVSMAWPRRSGRASVPANRKLGLPRASALIILNCPRTGVPLAVMEGR